MAFTENQISDVINKQLGRPATPFEVQKFSTASPQTLATLKDTYGKLNKDTSIADYLTSTGQDSSLEARTALGQKYGITNVGTAEGNTALLNALKSGSAPATSPVTGSITPATQQKDQTPTQTPPAYDTTTGLLTDYGRSQGLPEKNQKLQGTIQGATDTSATPMTREQQNKQEQDALARKPIDDAYQLQQDKQKAVADIDKQLASIKQSKIDEIARSGGVVNEASLTAEILRENAPLLAQRKVFAQEYTQANQNYQKVLADQKTQQANAFKEAQLNQGQQKIDIQQSQFTEKQKLAEDKLIQSGYKKVSDYSDGTKVGEHFVNLSGQKVTVDPQGNEQIVGTGTPVGSTTSTTSGSGQNISKGNVSYTDFASVPDAPTDQNRNTPYPGTAGKTYGAVYEDAVTYAETGKYQKMGVSSKPSTKAYDNAIKQKASNIAASLGMTEDQLRVAYAANKTAISKLITQKSTVSAFENKAKAQIDMILNGYTDPRTGEKVPSLNTSVSRTDYPLVNGLFVKGKILAGDTNAQLLSNALVTFSNEYAKIMGGGTGSASASSDSARKEAEGLISTALSEGTLDKTLGLLQKEMDTTIEGYDKQIKENSSSFVGGNTNPPSGQISNNDVKYTFDSVKGSDGYISPQDWNTVKSQYLSHGGTEEQFNSQFGNYKNPNNKNY